MKQTQYLIEKKKFYFSFLPLKKFTLPQDSNPNIQIELQLSCLDQN